MKPCLTCKHYNEKELTLGLYDIPQKCTQGYLSWYYEVPEEDCQGYKKKKN